MKETILKRRFKGLLALTVAFMLMFGSSLTVLAKEYSYDGLTSQNQLLTDQDTITMSAGVQLYINGTDATSSVDSNTMKYTPSQNLYVDRYDSSASILYLSTTQISTGNPSGSNQTTGGANNTTPTPAPPAPAIPTPLHGRW